MVNIKNTDYIDVKEIQRIIQDAWYNMFTTCDCDSNDVGIFLDLTEDRLDTLKDDLSCYKEDEMAAVFVRNEIKLIETLREAGYTDQILLLISY